MLTENARRPSEPAHLNSVVNLIPPTDQPPAYPGPTVAGRSAGVLDREADRSTAPMKGHFDEFHNQWLTH